MKSNSLAVTTSQNRESVTTVKNPLTWENAAKFYARTLPFFFSKECATVQDAKFLTGAIIFGLLSGSSLCLIFHLLLTIFG